jgi:hypothetical protein
MGKPVIGICRLCLKTAELQESHIVSKFFWRGSGIFKTRQAYNLQAINNPSVKIHNQQDGFKERLLCKRCEGKRSNWEKYSAALFFQEESPTLNPPRHPKFIIESGIDYKTLKLLILSTLWLMAISTRVFYNQVKLNARKTEQLRKMIVTGRPCKSSRYGCVFTVLVTNDYKPLRALFSQPQRLTRTRNGKTSKSYGFIVAGIHWQVFVSNVVGDVELEKCFVKENGSLIVRVRTIDAFPYLNPLIDDLRVKSVGAV